MRDDERMSEMDELDRRIDAMLRSYAEPPEATEPRVALARMMDRARAEMPARSPRWWMWGMAGAAACLVAVMAALWVTRGPRAPEIAWIPKSPQVTTVPDHPARAAVSGVQAVANRRTTQAGPSSTRKEVASTTTALPKLAVFPTPRPLTPEEEALVAFAKHGPPEVQRAVLEDQKHWDDPIIVAESGKPPPQSGNQQDQ